LVEEDMELTEKGIVDKTGLNPGEEKQILLTYQMPMNEKVSQWAIEQSFLTEKIQVVIQPDSYHYRCKWCRENNFT
jgi:hypothetical protein